MTLGLHWPQCPSVQGLTLVFVMSNMTGLKIIYPIGDNLLDVMVSFLMLKPFPVVVPVVLYC